MRLRKAHNEKLYNLCSSPNIIRFIIKEDEKASENLNRGQTFGVLSVKESVLVK
jgi:hypothetical protein